MNTTILTAMDVYEEIKNACEYFGVGFHGMREVAARSAPGGMSLSYQDRKVTLSLARDTTGATAGDAPESRNDKLKWLPIAGAPKNTPILAWCDHEADPYIVTEGTDKPSRLTKYAAHCEGMAHAPTGMHIVEWGGGYYDGEDDGGGSMPDWWFVAGSEYEVVANPTHYMLVDPPPLG